MKSTPLTTRPVSGSRKMELSICPTDESRMVEWHFEPCAHAPTLSSVGPSNSASHKGPDNRCGDDATFDVLPSQKQSVVQIENSLIYGTTRSGNSRQSGPRPHLKCSPWTCVPACAKLILYSTGRTCLHSSTTCVLAIYKQHDRACNKQVMISLCAQEQHKRNTHSKGSLCASSSHQNDF